MSMWRNRAAWPPLLVVCALVALGVSAGRRAPAGARPLTAEDDDRVLERLPARDDGLRRALAARPDDAAAAAALAGDLVRRARAAGDPRFLGRAQAVLAPWWDEAAPPHDVLVLRATIKQSLHDFEGALGDLAAAVRGVPDDAQAWLTRATVQLVVGRIDEARESCAGLVGRAPPLIVTACVAAVDGVAGRTREAAVELGRAVDGARQLDAATRGWALTTLAELLARAGDPDAERRFREALAETPDDGYLLAAFADWLLDAGRRDEAARLLAGRESDALLLRRALAEGQGSPLVAELAARHRAARARGDRLHQREEARFLLELADRPAEALPLAVAGFAAQREPADVRLLLEAALAAGRPEAAQPAVEHVRATGLEGRVIHELVRRVEAAR